MADFRDVPRRIFLDSCTVQALRDFGDFIYEGEAIDERSPLGRVPNGVSKVCALRDIFRLTERAGFEWVVSQGSVEEAAEKRDPGHLRWLFDVADHTKMCLEQDGPTDESMAHAMRLDEPRFGYLSRKDRRLLQDAIALRCDAFLTMERRLPRNAAHLFQQTRLRVLSPLDHWQLLAPWAALWL